MIVEDLTDNDWKYILTFKRREFIQLIKSQLNQGKVEYLDLFEKLFFHLKYKNSYPFNLETFENTIYYRGRIYKKELDTTYGNLDTNSNFLGYNKKDSFVPPASLTPEGRVNEKGVVFLYVGDREQTAVIETVKDSNDVISVAAIRMNKRLKLFNACHCISALIEKDEERAKWLQGFVLEMAECFYAVNEKLSDYVICQHIGKLLIKMEYDGIAYFSSKSGSLFASPCYDFAIFNYSSCEPINSKLVKVNNLKNIYGEIIADWSTILKSNL